MFLQEASGTGLLFPLPLLAWGIYLLARCCIANFLVWVLATKAFFPFVFSSPVDMWQGSGLAARGRIATISYRSSRTEASSLPRLTLPLRGFTPSFTTSIPQPQPCKHSPTLAEGFHAKKHILRSQKARQLTADDCSSPEVKGSLCRSHPGEGHTHTARVLGHFMLL